MPGARFSPTAQQGLVIQVNGQPHQVAGPADTPLLYVLRDELQLRGPRFGCGLAQCGACTVHIDGRAVRACRFEVGAVGSGAVTTLEGLGGAPGQLSPLQQAFIDEQAAQCGYCTNGMIMQAASLLATNPAPTEAEIRTGMANNLCRCGTHLAVIRAIQSASA
jgi:nicotinate dehydrogenase subunit A